MSRKIIGVTVGTTLPKPNFKQTDPNKGDYIRNKPDFDGLKTKVDTIDGFVGDKSVAEQITDAISSIDYYYTKDEIDNMGFVTFDEIDDIELITTADIDAICAGSVAMASEVAF